MNQLLLPQTTCALPRTEGAAPVTTAITAAMPITMPDVVRVVRSLWTHSAWRAILTLLIKIFTP